MIMIDVCDVCFGGMFVELGIGVVFRDVRVRYVELNDLVVFVLVLVFSIEEDCFVIMSWGFVVVIVVSIVGCIDCLDFCVVDWFVDFVYV